MNSKLWETSTKLLLNISIVGLGALFALADKGELLMALSIEGSKIGLLGIADNIKKLWFSSRNGVENKNIQVVFSKVFITACIEVKQNYLASKFINEDIKIDNLIKRLIKTFEEIFDSTGENPITETELLKTINSVDNKGKNVVWQKIEIFLINEGVDEDFSEYFCKYFQPICHELFFKELLKPESTEGWRTFNNLILESIHESIIESKNIILQNQDEILFRISEMKQVIGVHSYKEVFSPKRNNQIKYPDFVKMFYEQNKIIINKLNDIKDDTSFIKKLLINSQVKKQKWYLLILFNIYKYKIIISTSIIIIILLIPWKSRNKEIKTRERLVENLSQYIVEYDKYLEISENKIENYSKDRLSEPGTPNFIDLDNQIVPVNYKNSYIELTRTECLKFIEKTHAICKEISTHYSNNVNFKLDEVDAFAEGEVSPTGYNYNRDPVTKWEGIVGMTVKNGAAMMKSFSVKSKNDALKFKKLLSLILLNMKNENEEYEKESFLTSSLIYKIITTLEKRFTPSPTKISLKLPELQLHENIYSWSSSDRFLKKALADSFMFFLVKKGKKPVILQMPKDKNNPMIYSTSEVKNQIFKGDTILCAAISKEFIPYNGYFAFGFCNSGPCIVENNMTKIIGVSITLPGYKLVKRNYIWYSIFN